MCLKQVSRRKIRVMEYVVRCKRWIFWKVWALDSGLWTLDAWTLDIGCWMLDAGCSGFSAYSRVARRENRL
jgi:hypothetical protein